jgi:hypothetical protein
LLQELDQLVITSVRYDPATSPAEVRAINQKLRKAIETEGRRGPVEGLWWQLSLTVRSDDEPSAIGFLRIARDRDGGLNLTGRAWQEDGTLSARYWSEAAKERRDPAGVLYFWKGERPRHANAPQLEGTGEISLETVDRGSGYWTRRSPASAFEPTRQTWSCWTAGARRTGPSSSRSASGSGSRPRTLTERRRRRRRQGPAADPRSSRHPAMSATIARRVRSPLGG